VLSCSRSTVPRSKTDARPPCNGTTAVCRRAEVCQKPVVNLDSAAGGWQLVKSRRARRSEQVSRRRSLLDLRGRCFNCLSFSHRASCWRPTRCFRCFKFGHRAALCSVQTIAVKKAAEQQRDQQGLRVPVWQRLSEMEGSGHQDLQQKGSVWRRITPSTESSTQPALMAASSGATAPELRSMRKRRHAKRRRGAVEQAFLPLPPPSDHDAPLVMQEDAGSDESSVEPTCVLELSIGMAQEEVALRRALYVMVVGTRPKVLGAEVVEEVARCFGIDAASLVIHQAMPEDFLLFLPDEDTATRVFNEGGVFRGPRFNLQFKRWSRFTHATTGALPFLVDVQIWGIPAHAWARSTVEHLLHDSCLVSDIHPATALKSDFSFKLRAWCFDPKNSTET
jgi:hypothetical protein